MAQLAGWFGDIQARDRDQLRPGSGPSAVARRCAAGGSDAGAPAVGTPGPRADLHRQPPGRASWLHAACGEPFAQCIRQWDCPVEVELPVLTSPVPALD